MKKGLRIPSALLRLMVAIVPLGVVALLRKRTNWFHNA